MYRYQYFIECNLLNDTALLFASEVRNEKRNRFPLEGKHLIGIRTQVILNPIGVLKNIVLFWYERFYTVGPLENIGCNVISC